MFMLQESGRRESVPDPENVLGKEGSLVQGGYGTVLRRHRVLCLYCYIARNGLIMCGTFSQMYVSSHDIEYCLSGTFEHQDSWS